MPESFKPKLDMLPRAQRELWPELAPASALSFVLYGGTAIALHLGHRQSVDFDFFRHEPLKKAELRKAFGFLKGATVLQDEPNTLSLLAETAAGRVRVSYFGGIEFGRVKDPLRTSDAILLVASLDDLMATKLKTILDRAEARDYRDIAAMLRAGVSLPHALSGFRQMFEGEPGTVLRALGYLENGDLPRLGDADRKVLRDARDKVRDLPEVKLLRGSLVGRSS